METNSKNFSKYMLKQFITKCSINKLLIIDDNGKILASSQKISSEIENIINSVNKMGILKFKNEFNSKNLKNLILEYIDYQIILTKLQNENYIVAINDNKSNLEFILNELSNLVGQINNVFTNKDALEKFHLDANIEKLEEYLKLMQPPKFKDIKKLIDYIS
ncbi:MAG: hypothetical protein HWN67_07015 [Candidatus Helarchaeota archaeon]|nr:hypothetical protein [Candidatus Helarchaeota archaeon]